MHSFYFTTSGIIYYLSLAVAVILLPILLLLLYRSFDVLGLSLAQWVKRAQRREDEATANKMQDIRKLLETLAHDVLKHRLLGMISLVRLLDGGDGKPRALSTKEYDDFLEEIFRLCGAKAAPQERLWTRWRNTFSEIKAIAGRNLLLPIADPMLTATDRMMLKLRGMFKLYVAKDKASAVTPQALLRLNVEESEPIHKEILSLASNCRMRVCAAELLESAVSALCVQMGEAAVAQRVELRNEALGDYLSPAPMRLLATSVLRLLDNAIAQGEGRAAVKITLETDFYSDDGYLKIQVFDTTAQIPQSHQYGDGLKGISRSLADFGCGFSYELEDHGEFKKAALITVPVSEPTPIKAKPISRWRYVGFALLFLCLTGLFLLSVYRVFGGAPIRFAGIGETVVEFAVDVGEKLSIPLCEGGSMPRAEVSIKDGTCWKDQCTLNEVIASLEPCAKSLLARGCPKRLEWTPAFEDGARQGRIYELTIRCHSLGPPQSEDVQNIRLLVTRPNSRPELLMMQIQDLDSQETRAIYAGKTVEVAADANLRFRAVAVDKDTDLLIYRLILPDGKSLVSYDGEFLLPLEWSQFGTWTAVLQISDMVSEAKEYKLRFKANQLRPIELRNIGVWSQRAASSLNCRGMGNSRLCDITDGEVNELNIQLWFDPLLSDIAEQLTFTTTPDSPIEVVAQARLTEIESQTTLLGDRWEFRERASQQTLAIVELTNISTHPHLPTRDYGFRVSVAPLSPLDSLHWPVYFRASELQGRCPELQMMLVFSRHGQAQKSMLMSSKHIVLQEYEKESDERTARAGIRLFGFGNKSDTKPEVKAIVCENPALSQAFEEAKLVSIGDNAWNLELRLKQGCINGLNENTPQKDKLCFLELVYDKKTNENDFLWISIKDRACPPRVEKLELISSADELANNHMRWNFTVIDADANLNPQSIRVIGTNNYSLHLHDHPEAEQSKLERISGVISANLNCNSAPKQLSIELSDHSALSTRKALPTSLNCPPLVSTEDGKDTYHSNEGEPLSIALLHDDNVKLSVEQGVGAIEEKNYVWNASCMYGKGPHRVQIGAQSPKQYGRPLELKIYVARCIPRLALYANGHALSPSDSLHVDLNAEVFLRAQIQKAENSRFTVHSIRDAPQPSIAVEQTPDADTLRLRCGAQNASETLYIQAIPTDANDPDYLPSPRVPLKIHCRSSSVETQV
ncbi:MAG: hypothetical protein WC966_09945 [Bradymonadales bacterium]|jgi:hypothetical protein